MIFIGYESGSKAYRFYDPNAERVVISRDAVFDEAGAWKWKDDGAEASDTGTFTIEYTEVYIPVVPTTEHGSATPRTPSPADVPATPEHDALATLEHDTPATPVQFVSPPPDDELDLDDDHDDAPLRFRAIDNIIGARTTPPGVATRNLDAELHFTSAEEPATFAAAEREPCWRAAMTEEMKAITDNATWELVELPTGHRAIGLKWVYKVKRDEHGNIVRHKARLVAKGYVQRVGVDYDEVFAPVARMESVCLMLAVAAHQGWEVHHMDVKSAFLNGELKEEVYVVQPPGYVVKGAEHKVLRLRKALYGLKQAPRAWNAKFDATMLALGFQRSCSEHGVYTRTRGASRLLVITGHGNDDIAAFKAKMKKVFRMSDLGLLSYYLGIEVHQSSSGITLRQAAYAGKLLESRGIRASTRRWRQLNHA